MTFEKLIRFIDIHTDNGKDFPLGEYWYESQIQEEAVSYINIFSSSEWLKIQEKWQNKSDLWIECLINILDNVNSSKARQLIIYIAFNGTDENFLDAMECIRDFKQDVAPDTLSHLQARSSIVLSRRLKMCQQN